MDKVDKDRPERALSRRDFLKLPGVIAGAHLVNQARKYIDVPPGENPPENVWPRISIEDLPEGEVREILTLIPRVVVNSEGYLISSGSRVPFAETEWSRQNRRIIHPDALVVHWSANPHPEEATIRGLLSGYDEQRTSRDRTYEFITSAHATIGPYLPEEVSNDPDSHVSILQTQAPQNGALTVSSHLREDLSPEHAAYLNADHPINAMQTLLPYYDLPRTYNYLFNVLRSSGEDLNLRTVSLELLGQYFDSESGHPDPQLVANAVGVIFAYMNRYPEINFANITGHYEIQIDKADPGKKFMAELRLLLALKVLESGSQRLKENFFNPFLTESGSLNEAVKRFFDFHWDYLVSSYWGYPKEVYAWEQKTGFWKIYQSLFEPTRAQIADRFIQPVSAQGERGIILGNRYTRPDYHEGVDINVQATRTEINEDLGDPIASTANGKVIFAGEIPGRPGLGNTIVIEHVLPSGSKVLSLYGHLDQMRVTKGRIVGIGEQIATMGNSGGQQDSHLHFAVMPASAKREKELSQYLQWMYRGEEVTPYTEDEEGRIYIVSSRATRQFVERYYFEPLGFIEENS